MSGNHVLCGYALDDLDKIANVVIAVLTFIFSIYIYIFTAKKEEKKDKSAKKTDSLKSLIFELNLKRLFTFFQNIERTVTIFSRRTLEDAAKEASNNELQDYSKNLRLQFTDLLLAVDVKLYDNVLEATDGLVVDLTILMFDNSFDFTVSSTYEQQIGKSISEFKTKIIRYLHDSIV